MGEIALSAGMLQKENVAPTRISISIFFPLGFNLSKRKKEKINLSKFPSSLLKPTYMQLWLIYF